MATELSRIIQRFRVEAATPVERAIQRAKKELDAWDVIVESAEESLKMVNEPGFGSAYDNDPQMKARMHNQAVEMRKEHLQTCQRLRNQAEQDYRNALSTGEYKKPRGAR